MKNFRALSWILALLTVAAMCAGCSGNKENGGENIPFNDVSESQIENSDLTDSEAVNQNVEAEPENVSKNGDFKKDFKVTKINSINADISTLHTGGKGSFYFSYDDSLYGIITLDGKKNTGAKYTECTVEGNFFKVTTAKKGSFSVDDVSTINCYGLVDETGREIIPMKYAAVTKISDRYFRVIEATKRTTNKDDAILYVSNSAFISLGPDEDDPLFKGKWYIYDATTGKKVSGVSGTKTYGVMTYGEIIKYVTDKQENVWVNANGQKLPEGATVYNNGCYVVKNDGSNAVYKSNGDKLFVYDPMSYIPYESQGDYFAASVNNGNGKKYVLMDKTGKVVSAEFDNRPTVSGELILVDGKVYNIEGENIIDGEFDRMYFDNQWGEVWALQKDKIYTLITSDGSVLYQVNTTDSSVTSFDTTTFVARKKADDKFMSYSLADKDFTVIGNSVAPWLVQNYEEKKPAIIDTISGETLLSGYDDYEIISVPGSMYYIYAKSGSVYDIYTVK